jgi:hypothetical protein
MEADHNNPVDETAHLGGGEPTMCPQCGGWVTPTVESCICDNPQPDARAKLDEWEGCINRKWAAREVYNLAKDGPTQTQFEMRQAQEQAAREAAFDAMEAVSLAGIVAARSAGGRGRGRCTHGDWETCSCGNAACMRAGMAVVRRLVRGKDG